MMAVAARSYIAPQPKIHDYAILGDGRSAALVGPDGTIDWLCWPRFESPPVFARLLDADRGGSFRIAPIGDARITRRYVEHSNVLATRIESREGSGTLLDAMTVASEEDKRRVLVPDHELLRVVHCDRGELELSVRVEPRFDFGRRTARAVASRLGIRWQCGNELLALRCDAPIHLDDDGVARGQLRLHAGDSVALSLTYDEEGPALLPPLGAAARERIDRSIAWWQAWIARARYDGPFREQVLRSALAVKLMAYAPSGAIVAAPTTSLPELIHGGLNWDYRYCWLRDASFTVRALLALGYIDEACAFGTWLIHATRLTRPELRVLYDVFGNRPIEEHIVPAFGYRESRPVRIGNAARHQLQLDCHGEVIDAVAQLATVTGELDRDSRRALRQLGDYVCRNWRRPDQGIWEPRGPAQHNTHSRLLCWVAMDRLLSLADAKLLDRIDRDRFAAHRAAIRDDIETNAFVPGRGYTRTLHGSELDASVLLMSWYGFHRGDDPRMLATAASITRELGAGPGLLRRNHHSTQEGAFWICSFWLVEHLVAGGGTLHEAEQMMRAALGYASELGLMAEEIDPVTRDGLGNFPQAYTHVGAISAALSLEKRRHHELG